MICVCVCLSVCLRTCESSRAASLVFLSSHSSRSLVDTESKKTLEPGWRILLTLILEIVGLNYGEERNPVTFCRRVVFCLFFLIRLHHTLFLFPSFSSSSSPSLSSSSYSPSPS